MNYIALLCRTDTLSWLHLALPVDTTALIVLSASVVSYCSNGQDDGFEVYEMNPFRLEVSQVYDGSTSDENPMSAFEKYGC